MQIEGSGGESAGRGLLARFEEPVDGASLAAFRIVLGLLVAVFAIRFAARGWIETCYVEPKVAFKYPGFEWVEAWSAPWIHLHFALLALFSFSLAAGFFSRTSALAVFVLFTYVELLDKTYYLNHYYFVSLVSFLAILLPLGRALSVNAVRRGGGEALVARGAIWALRLQVGLVYFHAGLAKVGRDWLLEGLPLSIWLSRHGDLALVGPLFERPETAIAASWAGCLFDLTIPFWLLWRRTRPWAYAAVVLFHLATGFLFPIGIFPWVMIGSTLVFFDPDWPRALRRRLAGRHEASAAAADAGGPAIRARLGGWVLAVLALHFVVQAAWPLRGRFYPGDRLWTQEGFRFSWQVMLVERAGSVDLIATDPDARTTWVVDLESWLTPLQKKQVAIEPDMLLGLAHRVAADLRERGHPRIEVRADCHVSLNGRPSRPFVDPTVDLAREEEGWRPRRWILRYEP